MTLDAATIDVIHDPKQGRFLCDLNGVMARKYPETPVWLFDAALKARMEADTAARYKHYVVYTERLPVLWAALRDMPPSESVTFCVAQGYPTLNGLVLSFESPAEDCVMVTLPGPAELKNWRPAWIEANVNAAIERRGINGIAHPGQIRTLFARIAYYGEGTAPRPIAIRRKAESRVATGHYRIVTDVERLELSVHVYDVNALAGAGARRILFEEVDDALWRLAASPGASPVCRVLWTDLGLAFDAALAGPQRFGFDLPLILPAGFFLREEESKLRLSDPIVLERLAGSRARDDLHAAPAKVTELLDRRGLLMDDGKINPRTVAYPLIALDAAGEPTRLRYMNLARAARAQLEYDERELQALTIPVTEKTVAGMVRSFEDFWRDCAKESLSIATGGQANASVVAITSFLPLSLPWSARKAKSELGAGKQHDGSVWLPLVVREMVGLSTIDGRPEGIASCLAPAVSQRAVEKALEALTHSGMITFDTTERRYRQPTQNIVTGDDLPSKKLRQVHEEFSDLIAASLELIPSPCRSRATTLRMTAAAFAELKTKIRAWLLARLDESAKEQRPEAIYLLSVQAFYLADR